MKVYEKNKLFLIIGVCFLIFLIVGSKCIINKKKDYYSCLPVTLGVGNIPLFEMEIQGEKYPIGMDLGSKFEISLYPDVLKKLDKKPCGTLVGRDVRGQAYETPAYQIPLVKIDDLSFSNVLVKETSTEFIKNTTFWIDPDCDLKEWTCKVGTIGRALLIKYNWLLDFQRSLVIMTNDLKKLKTEGYDLEQFIKVPFQWSQIGSILLINTNMGVVRLAIDTGATFSCLRESFLPKDYPIGGENYNLTFVTTSKFLIGEKDFGPMNLYLMNITQELNEIDGLLGMDFLEKHIVYLDYAKKMAYIGGSL